MSEKKTARERKVVESAPLEPITAPAFLRRKRRPTAAGIRVGKETVEAKHLDKVFWPEEGYTKGDLLAYYLAVGKTIMPYLEGRPAILKRYPNGMADDGFFQHEVKSAPTLLTTKQMESEAGRRLDYAIYTSLASLVYLANIGTIAQNPWHSTVERLDRPDYVVLDLDPKGAPFENVLEVALATRDALAKEGLVGFVKTSGSTGLHIYVPIKPEYGYDVVARFSERISTGIARAKSKIATVERKLAERQEQQVYVDWQQNAKGKSAASVYSVRAKPGATVSTPVTWEEVERGSFALSDFTIATVPGRLEEVGDLWKDLFSTRQELPK